MNSKEKAFREDLSKLSREELEDLLWQLYDNNETVREGLDLLKDRETNKSKVIEKYQNKIKKHFYPGRFEAVVDTPTEVLPILEEAKEATLRDSEVYSELLLYAMEIAIDYFERFLMTSYFEEYENGLETLVKMLQDEIGDDQEKYNLLKERIDKLMKCEPFFLIVEGIGEYGAISWFEEDYWGDYSDEEDE